MSRNFDGCTFGIAKGVNIIAAIAQSTVLYIGNLNYGAIEGLLVQSVNIGQGRGEEDIIRGNQLHIALQISTVGCYSRFRLQGGGCSVILSGITYIADIIGHGKGLTQFIAKLKLATLALTGFFVKGSAVVKYRISSNSLI